MQTYAKKRLEIVIEAPARKKLETELRSHGAHGYTVLPALGGLGPSGLWSRDGLPTDTGQMVAIVCIIDPSKVEPLHESIFSLLSKYSGTLAISDCDVLRGDRY